MSFDALLPLYVLATSLVTGVVIFLLGEQRVRLRTALNLVGAVLKLVLVGVMIHGVFLGHVYETRWTFLPGMDFVLRADAMTILFSSLSAILWLVTTLYAIGYLEGFCVTATMGVSLSGNLLTFFVFYEVLTLTTYPLVTHRGTDASLRAGGIYLRYTLLGSAAILMAMVWLYVLAGPFDFREEGAIRFLGPEHARSLSIIFFLLVGGFGVKAALAPLHRWLPEAMVAPAPVSALLHAVAVVKAGAFGIVRVVYDVYGVTFAGQLGVLPVLAAAAAFTIVFGSVRALFQDDLKRRLAYSTVSQVSYIALGVAILGPASTIGGLVHLAHQGIMKITMFFCAGNLAETLGIHKISELKGAGRRMPWTMAAFTVAALGMIGVPPLAGFISKWYLGVGAAESGDFWVLGVLAASSLLNAAYFLPILHAAWFQEQEGDWPHEHHPRGRFETSLWLLIPPMVTAVLVVLAGLLAGTAYSPLAWVKIIALREY